MWIISDNSHLVSARAVCVVQLISMAESRTERLHILLTASSSRHRLTCAYLIQPSLVSAGFLKKWMLPSNSSHAKMCNEKIEGTASSRRKYNFSHNYKYQLILHGKKFCSESTASVDFLITFTSFVSSMLWTSLVSRLHPLGTIECFLDCPKSAVLIFE